MLSIMRRKTTNKVVGSLRKREKSMEEELKDVSAATEVSDIITNKRDSTILLYIFI